jgi:hypothetical protein
LRTFVGVFTLLPKPVVANVELLASGVFVDPKESSGFGLFTPTCDGQEPVGAIGAGLLELEGCVFFLGRVVRMNFSIGLSELLVLRAKMSNVSCFESIATRL